MNAWRLAVSMVTIATATPNASTLLAHTGVNVHLATSTLILTPAQVGYFVCTLVNLIFVALSDAFVIV